MGISSLGVLNLLSADNWVRLIPPNHQQNLNLQDRPPNKESTLKIYLVTFFNGPRVVCRVGVFPPAHVTTLSTTSRLPSAELASRISKCLPTLHAF
jgi:hypothetical protein